MGVMSKRCVGLILASFLALCVAAPCFARDVNVCGTASVYFSPHGGCTEAAISAVGQATSLILVQAYSMTSAPICDALVAAHTRGVTVRVISDRVNIHGRGSVTHDLQAAGIEVVYDLAHRIAHNKVMIIDGETVITGSFNWSASAEHANAENLIILRGPDLAQVYAERWEELRKICVER